MTDGDHGLGGRLPLADPATLEGPARELYELVMERIVPWAQSNGFMACDDEGRPLGPFNAALLTPRTSEAYLRWQSRMQRESTLTSRCRETVILTVGAVWHAEYELYAHSAAGLAAGLTEEEVQALRDGGAPDTLSADESVAHRVARALCAEHRISDALYVEAADSLGVTGVADVVNLTGSYLHTCAILNAFEVPVPD